MPKKAKVINYLQFLNKPIQDDSTLLWFISYLEPKTNKTERFENKSKPLVVKEYKRLEKRFKKLNSLKKESVTTTTIIKEKTKSKFNPKGTNNKLVIEEIQTKALELKVDGLQPYEIQTKLIELFQISGDAANKAAAWAYEELAKDIDDDFIRLTIFRHTESYDDLYKKFMDLGSHKLAIGALKAKEILNGIGADIFELQINNVFEDSEQLITYGMNQLTNSEQIEFIQILNKLDGVKQLEATNNK